MITLVALLLFSVPAYPQALAVADNLEGDSPDGFATEVEQAPTLVGGIAALEKAIQYPQQAKQAKVEGTVYVKCVVNTDGSVIDATVIEGKGYGLDEEALRVASELRFRPGRVGNEYVSFVMYLPVEFKLP